MGPSKFKLLVSAVLLTAATCLANAADSGEQASAPAATPNKALTPDLVGGQLTPEQKKAAEDLAALVTKSALSAADSKKAQEMAGTAQNMARRADDIANAALATDREKVLKFLGINPNGKAALYYFVSFEMPIEVLRAYVVEAMWAGGTLVFRGVPPGRDLKDFLVKDMRSLVYGKGSSASLSIDPRLFDAYQVTAVPTIVFSEARDNLQCFNAGVKSFEYQHETHSYNLCPPIPDDKYWKMTGAVTTDYALREFINHGATDATPFLDALSKGLAMGLAAPKAQQPFAGEWKSAITPEELMRVQQAIEGAKKAVAPPAATTP